MCTSVLKQIEKHKRYVGGNEPAIRGKLAESKYVSCNKKYYAKLNKCKFCVHGIEKARAFLVNGIFMGKKTSRNNEISPTYMEAVREESKNREGM